jgi:hypothetical protein
VRRTRCKPGPDQSERWSGYDRKGPAAAMMAASLLTAG